MTATLHFEKVTFSPNYYRWGWSRARTVRSGLGWDRTESSFGRLIRAHLLLFDFCFYRMEAFFAEQAQGTRVVSFSDLGSALHSREFGVERVRCSHAAVEHPDQKNAPSFLWAPLRRCTEAHGAQCVCFDPTNYPKAGGPTNMAWSCVRIMVMRSGGADDQSGHVL